MVQQQDSSSEYKRALVKAIEKDLNVIVTGSIGYGKSMLLSVIEKEYRK